MKINNNDINMNKIMKAYQNLNQQDNNNVKKQTKLDQVNISNEAKEIQNIKETLENKSEIRQEKVDQIKNQIQNGTYQVDSQKIAEKIISDIE
ncbi:MAG: flagellar biosynthesis anti-sigma factor FlgM [Halanaerobiales bacterium]|nr:flagellar biosynthesis anti-sigma factor FlgM [Halanaerobiales bacterium]